jgi:hypothetical protein
MQTFQYLCYSLLFHNDVEKYYYHVRIACLLYMLQVHHLLNDWNLYHIRNGTRQAISDNGLNIAYEIIATYNGNSCSSQWSC